MSKILIKLVEPDFTDRRSNQEIIIDRLKSLDKELMHGFRMFKNKLSDTIYGNDDYTIISSNKKYEWKQNSEALYVMIHGLLGHPSTWNEQVTLVKQLHPNADIANVVVPFKGNCSLEDASDPILEMILNYILQFPNNPISIFGTSNGGRIASKIEHDLRITPTRIHVSTISGVHRGSQTMSLITQYNIAKYLYDQSVYTDLSFDSKLSLELLDKQREQLPSRAIRNFEFYATTEDTRLIDYRSALPKINQNEKHYIVHGVEHSSIVYHVCNQQVHNAVTWIKNQISDVNTNRQSHSIIL